MKHRSEIPPGLNDWIKARAVVLCCTRKEELHCPREVKRQAPGQGWGILLKSRIWGKVISTNGACEGEGSTQEKEVEKKGNTKACSLCVEPAQGSAFHLEQLCMHGKKSPPTKVHRRSDHLCGNLIAPGSPGPWRGLCFESIDRGHGFEDSTHKVPGPHLGLNRGSRKENAGYHIYTKIF